MTFDSKYKKIFVGVAWPYVNGDIHVGHYAGYLLPADICARYHRLRGRDVLMASGSDCFGTPITVEADKKKVHPKEIVEEYHTRDVELFKLLGLSYDLYTRTDTPNHIKVTQDFFIKHLEQGYIFRDSSKQYYSEEEKRFLPDRYVEGVCPVCKFEGARSDQCDNCGSVFDQGELINPLSKNTKTPVGLRETEHYFFDWGKLQGFLEDYIKDKTYWRQWVLSETKGWLKTGLKPRAITRDLDWGVPIPIDRIPEDQRIEGIENKRIYVWYEAVVGYVSASIEWAEINNKDWKPYWYDEGSYHYYFMGKDNLIFHNLFWPGQLHLYDEKLKLPDFPAINQYLNLGNKKFSKSRNVIVDTKCIVEKYGNDPVRFYLCLIMPENSDANFTWEDFYEKVNNVLIGNFGNFVNRVLTLAKGQDLSKFTEKDLRSDVLEIVTSTFTNCYEYLDGCRFRDYLNEVLKLSEFGNILMSDLEPWKLKDNGHKEFSTVIANLTFIVYSLGRLITPLLPETSKKLLSQLGLSEQTGLSELAGLKEELVREFSSIKVTSPQALFIKLEKEQVLGEWKR